MFFVFQSSSSPGWDHEGTGPQRWAIICPNQLSGCEQARGDTRVNMVLVLACMYMYINVHACICACIYHPYYASESRYWN